ncbi:MAG: phosphoglycerate kinase [Alphaproteobacteria bacterium]
MTQKIPTLDSFDFADKTVLLRVDFNVPMGPHNTVADNSRIKAVLPTIQELLAKHAKIIILSHLGRPEGKPDPTLSLRPVFEEFKKLLPGKIALHFCPETVGPQVEKLSHTLKVQEILFLENIRFHPEEESNDPKFAKTLAQLGDIYVNDAFSVSHRPHASVEALPRLLPHCAGRLFEKEVHVLESLLTHPKRPVMAILGGAKVSTKLKLIENLIDKMDVIALGGGMANTFLLAQKQPIGKSLAEPALVPECLRILEKAHKKGCTLILPTDVVIAPATDGKEHTTVSVGHVSENQMILDLGPKTIQVINDAIDTAQTLVWNGPVGLAEIHPFDRGTKALAQHIVQRTETHHLMSVGGGGDTASILEHLHLLEKFTYVSMAGGAFLEWMEGKTLPGVAALMK